MSKMPHKVFLVLFVALVIFSLSLPTFAQAKSGKSELLLSGNFFMTIADGSQFGTAMAQIYYGYFIFKHFQIGGGPNISLYFEDDATVVIDGSLFMRYYFQKSGAKFAFYIGARGYLSDLFDSYDSDSDFIERLYVSPHLGMKFYFTQKAAFDINAGYGFSVSNLGNGAIIASFGISFIL